MLRTTIISLVYDKHVRLLPLITFKLRSGYPGVRETVPSEWYSNSATRDDDRLN